MHTGHMTESSTEQRLAKQLARTANALYARSTVDDDAFMRRAWFPMALATQLQSGSINMATLRNMGA